ncbi:major facilitator superfamily domain-containing protein [Dipodascopsis uninucleata]
MQSYRQFRRIQEAVQKSLSDKENLVSEATKENNEQSHRNAKREKKDGSVSDTNDQPSSEDIIIVTWDSASDPNNPKNFSFSVKVYAVLNVAAIATAVGIAGSIDAAVLPQAAKDLHVSEVAESLAVGSFLVGFGFGAVLAAPFSEMFGRNAVYISTLIIFELFIMACGLAPNFGAQIVLRFFAGIFGSTPLVCAGGSIADLWDSLDKTWSFPLYAIAGFPGPTLGPVLASFVGQSKLSWRWAEWITLLFSGVVIFTVVGFLPETYGPLILKWKAKALREKTGDMRYRSEFETRHINLVARMKAGLTRPFAMAREPIILILSLYITILYIVLFTFLNGYTFIFKDVYGVSQGITNIIFVAMYVGMCMTAINVYPIYRKTKRLLRDIDENGKSKFEPEARLWFGMLGGSISIPISLFWMGWTDYPSISIWSPIIASSLFGYGMLSIFICIYMYLCAGGMTAVGIPFYHNMGVHWTLTIMGSLSVLLVPTPYVLYRWGHKIRQLSKLAVNY